MAYNINQIHLRGRLGKDAETRYSSSGKSYTKFSVATETGKDDTKKTTWHNVTMFGNDRTAAELVKGAEVTVIGRQEHTKRDDKYYSDVIADMVHVHEREPRDSGMASQPRQSASRKEQPSYEADDSDLPF